MGTKEYNFNTNKILDELPTFASRGITEFTVHDDAISGDKKSLLALMNAFASKAPDVFYTIPIQATVIDNAIVTAAQKLYCTLDIPLTGTVKGDALLFDKKLYSSKATMLNNAGLVFGFDMEWGKQTGDSYKAFRDRLDFAVSLYPNHIDFVQLEAKLLGDDSNVSNENEIAKKNTTISSSNSTLIVKPTGIYSSKDLEFSRDCAFACEVFYSAGRAVPWFNSVIKPLKIAPSAFFADFAEWQQCSSCSFESGFNPEATKHSDIEKMQLVFLQQKYEEKHREQLWSAVQDLVKLNGAFSRVASDGEESVVETSYNPDDLLSPQSYDIASFCDNACLEECKVKVFAGEDSPDYKIL